MITAILSVLTFTLAAGAGSFGPCPSVAVVSDFDAGAYMGTWYEILRSKDMPYEKGDCTQAHYALLPSGKVNVTNSEVRGSEVAYAHATATCASDGSAHCSVSFSKWAPSGDYQVLSTDYKQYAVVYSCFSIWVYHWSWGWLLSRTPAIDEQYFQYTQLLPDVPMADLSATNQVNCPGRNYS